MARDRILQIYRGTTAQNDAFTGAQGELTMDTARKEIRIHDGSTVGGNVVGLTPGFIAPFAGSTAPAGWLVCDGSAVSRTTYAKLFAVIGTTYGEGDGNSTFNLPDTPTQKIVKGSTLPVRGNGKTLGFMNGSGLYGGVWQGTGSVMGMGAGKYGTNVGTVSSSGIDTPFVRYTTLGITSDTENSGIVTDISSLTSFVLVIKY